MIYKYFFRGLKIFLLQHSQIKQKENARININININGFLILFSIWLSLI